MTEFIIITIFVLGAIGSIVYFDAKRYKDTIPDNSYTQIIRKLSKKYPLIPAGIGLIIGFVGGSLIFHFFDAVTQ